MGAIYAGIRRNGCGIRTQFWNMLIYFVLRRPSPPRRKHVTKKYLILSQNWVRIPHPTLPTISRYARTKVLEAPLHKHLGTLREANQGGRTVVDRLNASDARSTRRSARIVEDNGTLKAAPCCEVAPSSADLSCRDLAPTTSTRCIASQRQRLTSNPTRDRRGQLNNLCCAAQPPEDILNT